MRNDSRGSYTLNHDDGREASVPVDLSRGQVYPGPTERVNVTWIDAVLFVESCFLLYWPAGVLAYLAIPYIHKLARLCQPSPTKRTPLHTTFLRAYTTVHHYLNGLLSEAYCPGLGAWTPYISSHCDSSCRTSSKSSQR